MTAFTVEFERGAQKSLKKMDPQQARIIMSWIKKNLSGRMIRIVIGKGLVSNRSGEWRYRIGDYRLIADIQDEKVVILILESDIIVMFIKMIIVRNIIKYLLGKRA